MKHVGQINNTGSRVAVVFRVVPGEPNNCLVVYSDSLPNIYHDGLMEILESTEGQAEFELGNILGRKMFADGNYVLATLHGGNFIRKIPTEIVTMTPGGKQAIPLNDLNNLIADQKGVTIDQLAGTIDKTQSEIAIDDAAAGYTGRSPAPHSVPELETSNFEGGPTLAEHQSVLTNENLAENLIKQSESLSVQVKTLLDESKRLQKEAYDLNPALKPAARKRTTSQKKKA